MTTSARLDSRNFPNSRVPSGVNLPTCQRTTARRSSSDVTIENERVVNETGTQLLKCRDCEKEFPRPPGEQHFYRDKGFPPPRRCKPCRLDAKEKKRRPAARFTPGEAVTRLLGGNA